MAATTRRWTIFNAGVPGQNSRDGLARMQADVIDRAPAVAIIAFGMNDAINTRNSQTPDQFRANTREMIRRCRGASIAPILVTIHPVVAEYLCDRHDPHLYGPDGPNGRIAEYNAVIGELAREEHLALADWHARVQELGGATTDAASVLQNEANIGVRDGVHLTARGYREMAACIHGALLTVANAPCTVACFGDSNTAGYADPSLGDYPSHLARLLDASD